ncbi:hypothetical protein PCYB_002920 [Plasmodium cynomolgi strain B]|uniref:CYIR protein n=1 Tax=Plasmodium cynomolgi (strain B) TaxID=1120755 RepID=K6UNJ0_PLACD|nr:hypothetical protein PCYB_002920 [Plasmodium cynomolgi strain B]GAB69543.1 hypothetical protein PCYB_002920 [Plasmodium cynomolgi strain B]
MSSNSTNIENIVDNIHELISEDDVSFNRIFFLKTITNNFIHMYHFYLDIFKKLFLKASFRNKNPLIVFYERCDKSYNLTSANISCDQCKSPRNKDGPNCCDKEDRIVDWDTIQGLMANPGTNYITTICDYFIHWLYGIISKSKITDMGIYNLYNKMENKLQGVCNYKHPEGSETQSIVKIYDRKVLKDKRELYDFLEYYNDIKAVLNNENPKNKDKYCRYIKYIFNLYQEMEMNNYKELYNMESNLFKEKFKKIDADLFLLEKKCPGDYLNLIFDKDNKILRDFKKEKKEQLVEKLKKACDNPETHSVEDSPYDKHEYKDVLKDFSAYKVYEKLNNNNNIDPYCSDCNDLSNLESEYKGINQFCKKVARNLRNQLNDIKDLTNEDDRCLYFIYWTYEKVREIYNGRIKNIHEIPLFSKILGIAHGINYELAGEDIRKNVEAFKGVSMRNSDATSRGDGATQKKEEKFVYSSELSKYNPCFFYLDCTLDECKEMKDLFDYFKNYKSIKDKSSTVDNKYIQYCNYLTYINGLYEKNISNCCVCFKGVEKCREDCPHYFRCDELYNPQNLYDKFKCSNKISDKPFKKIKLPVSIDFYSKNITEKSKGNQYLQTVNYFTPISVQKMQGRMPKLLDGMSDTSDNILESDPFYTIVLGVFTIWGIFFVFFIYYKVIKNSLLKDMYSLYLIFILSKK